MTRNLEFVHKPAEEPEVEDDVYELRLDGEFTGVYIQDAKAYAGAYFVNEEQETDETFSSNTVSSHASLEEAKVRALELFGERTDEMICKIEAIKACLIARET